MISVFFRSSPLTLVLELVFSLLVVSLNRFLLCSLNWQAPSGGQQSSSCCDYSVIPIDFVLFFALLKNSHNCAKSLQLCLILCDPPPGSSVHGILQARILERVAILFSRRFSWPSDQTCLLHWQAGSLPLAPHGKPILLRILQLWFLHPWDKLQLMRPFIIRTAHIFHVSFVELPLLTLYPVGPFAFSPSLCPSALCPPWVCALSSLPGYWKALSLPLLLEDLFDFWLEEVFPPCPSRIAYTHCLIKRHCAAVTYS